MVLRFPWNHYVLRGWGEGETIVNLSIVMYIVRDHNEEVTKIPHMHADLHHLTGTVTMC